MSSGFRGYVARPGPRWSSKWEWFDSWRIGKSSLPLTDAVFSVLVERLGMPALPGRLTEGMFNAEVQCK